MIHVDPAMFPFLENVHDISPFPPDALSFNGGSFPTIKSVIHVEQTLELYRLIASQCAVYNCESKIVSICGTGKGAFFERETLVRDDGGILYARLLSVVYIPGLCGVSRNGSASPVARVVVPKEREPDWESSLRTSPEQAMLYRLSG